MRHEPVSLRRTEGKVAVEIEINSTASHQCEAVSGHANIAQRSRGVIATDQGVYKRRVSLVRAQREHWSERVGVVLQAHSTLRSVRSAKVGGDAEVVVEVAVE